MLAESSGCHMVHKVELLAHVYLKSFLTPLPDVLSALSRTLWSFSFYVSRGHVGLEYFGLH